ncbi:NfeD family protein [Chloroflexota bacterium]
MKIRKTMAIISTIAEECVIVLIVLWGLPRMGLSIPLWGLLIILAIIMIAWVSYSVFTFRLGTRALVRKDLVGMPNMIGCKGIVVNALTPEGLVRIYGELWIASSDEGTFEKDERVIVVSQDRLKLLVKSDVTEIAGKTYNHPSS